DQLLGVGRDVFNIFGGRTDGGAVGGQDILCGITQVVELGGEHDKVADSRANLASVRIDDAIDLVHGDNRLLGNEAEIGNRVAEICQRLGVKHLVAQVGDRSVQLLGGAIQPVNEAGRAPGDFLKIERWLTLHIGAIGQRRRRVGGGYHRDILVTEEI